ncbi:hypothetical protein [Streptomyces sp. NPDC057545]|uniref:hypothetical protein n=1 Tax=Streptomyces sp. NPDC057545 TaxID=3346164 RepID=UPI0036C9802B
MASKWIHSLTDQGQALSGPADPEHIGPPYARPGGKRYGSGTAVRLWQPSV